MAPSSSGLGRHPLKVKTAGSNPAGVTRKNKNALLPGCFFAFPGLDKMGQHTVQSRADCGSGSVVEHLLAKEKVVGSTPISRSTTLTTECEKVFRRWEALPEELPDSPA